MIFHTEIHILVQYYNDKSEERQKEIDYCFLKNLGHKNVKQMINFSEKMTTIPDIIKKNEKFVDVPSNERLNFKTAIQFANDY